MKSFYQEFLSYVAELLPMYAGYLLMLFIDIVH